MLAEIVVAVGVTWLAVAGGVAIPLVEGIVTKDVAPPWLRGLVLGVLSAAAGVVATAIDAGGHVPLEQAAYTVASTAIVALAAHYGLNVAGVLPALRRATASFGVGRPRGAHNAAPAGSNAVLPIPGYGRIVGPAEAVLAVKIIRDPAYDPPKRGGRAYRAWLASHVAALELEVRRQRAAPPAPSDTPAGV